MKTKKMTTGMLALMLMLMVSFSTSTSFAQTKTKDAMMKDCCMMKDGKMMVMKDGKTMSMDKDTTMTNGTKCMTTGECMTKDGKKMQMKEGDSMDMDGNMMHGGMMMKDAKTGTGKNSKKMEATAMYVCPMHSEITSNKPGKCSKCGMDMVVKK